MQNNKEQKADGHYSDVCLKHWEISQDLVSFFHNSNGENIKELSETIEFWLETILTTELSDDVDDRVEIIRVKKMITSLKMLSLKYTQEEILENLEFIAHGRSVAYKTVKKDVPSRKEEYHA